MAWKWPPCNQPNFAIHAIYHAPWIIQTWPYRCFHCGGEHELGQIQQGVWIPHLHLGWLMVMALAWKGRPCNNQILPPMQLNLHLCGFIQGQHVGGTHLSLSVNVLKKILIAMHNENKAVCNKNFSICAEEPVAPLYKQ